MTGTPLDSELHREVEKAGFLPLSAAERRVLRDYVMSFNSASASQGAVDDGSARENGSKWGKERTVRAGLIRFLCLHKAALAVAGPGGLKLANLRIVGGLDLAGAAVALPLRFVNCFFDAAPDFTNAAVHELTLTDSVAPGLEASFITVNGHLSLNRFTSSGSVIDLTDCRIKGNLDLEGADCSNPDRLSPEREVIGGTAIAADGAVVEGYVLMREKFRAEGRVGFLGSQVGGDIDCQGGTFNRPGGQDFPDRGLALDVERAVIRGTLFLRSGFTSSGEIKLTNSQIGGDLDCGYASFSPVLGPEYPEAAVTLDAERVTVKGSAIFRGTNAKGEIRLVNAQIGGDLDCDGATFNAIAGQDPPQWGITLNAERVSIKGSLFLRNVNAYGEVRLYDAQVGGSAELNGGFLQNLSEDPYARALGMDRASVKGLTTLSVGPDNSRFMVVGKISLVDARLNGVLVMDGADFKDATLDLSGASTSGFSDSGEPSWPKNRGLRLRGFVYDAIVGAAEEPEARLAWLALQPDEAFNTECYAQLAKVLEQAGNEDGARLVLQRMAEIIEKRSHRFWYLSIRSWLYAAIGYGFRPIYSIEYGAALAVVGWVIYRRSYVAGTMVPTDKEAFAEYCAKGAIPAHYPRLSPLMMSIENSLPLVKLGQADKWQPNPDPDRTPAPPQIVGAPAGLIVGAPRTISRRKFLLPFRRTLSEMAVDTGLQPPAAGRVVGRRLSRAGTSAVFVKRFIWVQILLGWLFATLFVAGFSGLIKK